MTNSEERIGRGGYGFSCRHVFLVLDGSSSMELPEIVSGKPKHMQVAQMVQQLIDEMDTYEETYLSIYTYDAGRTTGGRYDSVRIQERLAEYDVHDGNYVGNTDLTLWDPLRGHGGATPIGGALAHAFNKATDWVEEADGAERRRAVIYLLSDGENNVGDDGLDIRGQIDEFNQENGGKKGRVRLATVGYFQHREGENAEEDKARKLLNALPNNSEAFFESGDTEKILQYILDTIQILG